MLGILITGGSLGGLSVYDSHQVRNERIQRVIARQVPAKSYIRAGFRFYQQRKFALAYESFVRGKSLPDYNPEDSADYGDVDDLLQDSYWRMNRKEE